jgi:phospholipase/carboxylesterase
MNVHFSPPKPGARTVLALHGRGGCERQLLPLLRAVDRSLGVLAPRGEVSAAPGSAWCRRHGVGIPCPQDLRARADGLGRWLDRALPGLGLAPPLVVVGYSSGALMAAALAALRPDLVAGLALLRGAYPLPWLLREPGLGGTPVLASEGEADHLLSPAAFAAGVRIHRAAGARVRAARYPGAGHALCLSDVRDLRAWLSELGWRNDAAAPARCALSRTA